MRPLWPQLPRPRRLRLLRRFFPAIFNRLSEPNAPPEQRAIIVISNLQPLGERLAPQERRSDLDAHDLLQTARGRQIDAGQRRERQPGHAGVPGGTGGFPPPAPPAGAAPVSPPAAVAAEPPRKWAYSASSA